MKFIPLLFILLSLAFNSPAQKLDNVVKNVTSKVTNIIQKPKTPLKPVSPNLENVEYPFPVHYIDLNLQNQDLKMGYMDVPAKKPNGDVVVLMHGKNFCSAYWKKTASDLSKAGYRVIMPDQIGFGKSSKPTQLSYSFQLLAQNTKNLLDTLEIKNVIVLGHSMGGMLATRFTLMYPDVVKKLILENPIGLEDYKLTVPFQTVDENYKKELKQTYERLKDYEQTTYYGDHWKPEYDEWLNILAGMTLNADYPRIAWNAALTTEMIYMQPVCYEFERITAPTLLIIGQRDRTALVNLKTTGEAKSLLGHYPELGKLTAKKIANSQLVEIANVGHLPHIEAYAKFITPLLSFLKDDLKPHEEKETVAKENKTEKTLKTKLANLKPKAKSEKKQIEKAEKTENVEEKPKEAEEKEVENIEKITSTEEKVEDTKNETETPTIGKSAKAEQKINAKKKEKKVQTLEPVKKTEENTEEKTEETKNETEAPTIGKSAKAEQKINAKKEKKKIEKVEPVKKTEENQEEKIEETKNDSETPAIGKSTKAKLKINVKKKNNEKEKKVEPIKKAEETNNEKETKEIEQ